MLTCTYGTSLQATSPSFQLGCRREYATAGIEIANSRSAAAKFNTKLFVTVFISGNLKWKCVLLNIQFYFYIYQDIATSHKTRQTIEKDCLLRIEFKVKWEKKKKLMFTFTGHRTRSNICLVFALYRKKLSSKRYFYKVIIYLNVAN